MKAGDYAGRGLKDVSDTEQALAAIYLKRVVEKMGVCSSCPLHDLDKVLYEGDHVSHGIDDERYLEHLEQLAGYLREGEGVIEQ